MVDRIARRIEGRLQHNRSVIDGDTLAEASAAAKKADEPFKAHEPALKQPPDESSTGQLVAAALKETQELVRIEIALAKLEAKRQLMSVAAAAVGFVVAAVLLIITLSLGAVAIILALGGTAGVALGVAAAVLVLGGIAAAVASAVLPKKPLERTRHHFEDDFKQLKEHVA